MKNVFLLFVVLIICNYTIAQRWEEVMGIDSVRMGAYQFNSLVESHGNLYAFSASAGSGNLDIYPSFFKWNGITWSPFASGSRAMYALGRNNGKVDPQNMQADSAGKLYVAGFLTYNQYYHDSIGMYRWDDTAWTLLGHRYFRAISQIHIDKSNTLYIACDTISESNFEIAKLGSSGWEYLSGLNGNDYVNAIRVGNDGSVYAAGRFTDDSLSNRRSFGQVYSGCFYVAQWNGSKWTQIGQLDSAQYNNGNAGNPIVSIAIDASGAIYTTNGKYDSTISHYRPGNSYSDGSFRIVRWDGTSWQPFGSRLLGYSDFSNCSPFRIYTDPMDNIWISADMKDSALYSYNGVPNYTYHASWTGTKWKQYSNLYMDDRYDCLPFMTQSGEWYAATGLGSSLFHYIPACSAPVQQDICIVTIDSAANKPVVVWEKSDKYASNKYVVYRAAYTGTTFTQIAELDRDSLSAWMDTSADPTSMSYRYSMVVRDTCGLKGVRSRYHQTIYLSYVGSGAFSWVPYAVEDSSVTIASYDLYRDSAGTGQWQLVTTVTGTTASDSAYLSFANARYKVIVTLTNQCQPGRSFASISSNTLSHIVAVPTGFAATERDGIHVYPNPSRTYFVVNTGDAGYQAVTVTDMLGRVISETSAAGQSFSLDARSWIKGVYTCQVQTESKTYRVRIVRD